MNAIAATLITCNEALNIEEALKSVSWTDEIIVVDSGSSDGTTDLCRRYTDKIFERRWSGYVDQKNFAVEKARHDWIFSIDADERPSAALIDEVQRLRREPFACAGYRIPRVTFFMGRWLRHGDWYPDYQLRLFDRRQGRWQGGRVHESVKLREGKPGLLAGELQHFSYRRISDYLKRLESYTSLAALDYLDRGKEANPARLLFDPAATFLKGYCLKRGFLDGVPGFMAAVMGSVSVYFKYAKLYELRSNKSQGFPGAGRRP